MIVVKPVLKRFHSPDVFDLGAVAFAADQPCSILIQALIAPEGVDGEESFDFVVCNSIWVEQRSKKGALSGRHHLFVSAFDLDEIRAFWMKVVSESAGSTWDEVAEKLGRYGMWEFEDYRGS